MFLSVATNTAGRVGWKLHWRGAGALPAALLLGLISSAGGAQDPASKPAQDASSEQPLLRVNVDLVQMDVVVTDAHGNHIDDLKPEEFEVLEGGKPQKITNFSYISGARTGLAVTARQTDAPVAPARIAPGAAARTIAVVVDDLGVSEQSFMAIRAALDKFIGQQVGPDDLVAIVTTSGRLGSFQRLTADKRILRAAVNKLRSLPYHRPGVSDDDFTCAWFNHKSAASLGGGPGVQDEDAWLAGTICTGCEEEVDPQREMENDHRSRYYGLLTISALRRVVDGLRELPGRRSILLFTEGLPLVRAQGAGETNQQVTDGYQAFLNHANRSGIVVNTIDPRGLIATFDTAERSHTKQDACQDARRMQFSLDQVQLGDMARRTGGISIINDNDLAEAMTRVAADQLGYYLIGYKPPETQKQEGFRKIAIRVTRPGLKARFHSSLYEETPVEASAGDSGKRLIAAVASPFTLPHVRVHLATRYWDAGAETGAVLDTLLEIDARDLQFSAGPDGRRKATFDILALIYGSESKPLESFEKSYTVSLADAAYQRALREGLVQQLQLPVKRAGAYQLRSAVRDHGSGQVGSASEFVEVPDLTRGEFAVSGIALSGGGTDSATRRRFRAGETVAYACQVLNAQAAPDGTPHVEVRASLYRDGRALGTSAPMPVDPKGQTDPKRLVVSNDFRLGKQLAPGDYTLQLTVADRNAPSKRATAVQIADFEIVE